jgi:6-pyruvoyltetrahydropterin/6-carboxytetrahydropterin synthase
MEPTEYPELTTIESTEVDMDVPYSIEFKRHFYAAHRLAPPYAGKCSNIHGHNYQVTVNIDSTALNKAGVVVEFDDVKQVIDLFDHTLILFSEDPLYERIYELGLALMPVTVNPTTEALSKYIAKMILTNCIEDNPTITCVAVELKENDHISSTGIAFSDN